jgi:hypothetical protein
MLMVDFDESQYGGKYRGGQTINFAFVWDIEIKVL